MYFWNLKALENNILMGKLHDNPVFPYFFIYYPYLLFLIWSIYYYNYFNLLSWLIGTILYILIFSLGLFFSFKASRGIDGKFFNVYTAISCVISIRYCIISIAFCTFSAYFKLGFCGGFFELFVFVSANLEIVRTIKNLYNS